ncbi:MAG: hypothetical protein ACYTHJ_14320 [Planctomycetota bacterium]|jgi:hypothetical protein
MARAAGCLFLLAAMFILGGCSTNAYVLANYPHAYAETLTEDEEEHFYKMTRLIDRDSKGIIEDLDMIFQSDRPSRLSRWHDR